MMKIKRITEVGVAVRDLEAATKLFVDLLGAEAGEVVTVDLYKMRYRMCRVGKVDFELMEPIGDEGVIASFLKSKGEGLHHVAFAVDDIEEGMNSLKKKGVRFVTEGPMEMHGESVDKDGNKISGVGKFTFSLPKSIAGILLEYIEYPDNYVFP
jgi:methylmalonyl-CoA/ethylmalonyl-CoA epimerase